MPSCGALERTGVTVRVETTPTTTTKRLNNAEIRPSGVERRRGRSWLKIDDQRPRCQRLQRGGKTHWLTKRHLVIITDSGTSVAGGRAASDCGGMSEGPVSLRSRYANDLCTNAIDPHQYYRPKENLQRPSSDWEVGFYGLGLVPSASTPVNNGERNTVRCMKVPTAVSWGRFLRRVCISLKTRKPCYRRENRGIPL